MRLAISAFAAPASFADPCAVTLEDSAGNGWDLDGDAAVVNGENDAYDDGRRGRRGAACGCAAAVRSCCPPA
jgi:hypothetical protein